MAGAGAGAGATAAAVARRWAWHGACNSNHHCRRRTRAITAGVIIATGAAAAAAGAAHATPEAAAATLSDENVLRVEFAHESAAPWEVAVAAHLHRLAVAGAADPREAPSSRRVISSVPVPAAAAATTAVVGAASPVGLGAAFGEALAGGWALAAGGGAKPGGGDGGSSSGVAVAAGVHSDPVGDAAISGQAHRHTIPCGHITVAPMPIDESGRANCTTGGEADGVGMPDRLSDAVPAAAGIRVGALLDHVVHSSASHAELFGPTCINRCFRPRAFTHAVANRRVHASACRERRD